MLTRHQVVPDFSSFLNRRDIETCVFINENHMNMCKFNSFDDQGYKDFGNGLKEFLNTMRSNAELRCSRDQEARREELAHRQKGV